MLAPHLAGSVRGPTGERDSSSGDVLLSVICATSASKLRDSFLSKPASLPVYQQRWKREHTVCACARVSVCGVADFGWSKRCLVQQRQRGLFKGASCKARHTVLPISSWSGHHHPGQQPYSAAARVPLRLQPAAACVSHEYASRSPSTMYSPTSTWSRKELSLGTHT
jgi:hypothetical protein